MGTDIESSGKNNSEWKGKNKGKNSELRNMNLAIATFLGVIIGSCLQSSFDSVYNQIRPRNNFFSTRTDVKGMVTTLDQTPFRSTSHVDDKGRPIEKQQFLEPFVVPNFVGYSVATWKPGQIMMPVHEHRSMHEFFYVLEGSGMVQIEGKDYKVEKGWFLHMAPHEKHGIWVPEDSPDGDLKMAVCGVTVGD